eukprot:SAG31_NODE_940_length_10870_cov_12.600501_7_plen_118_part_00
MALQVALEQPSASVTVSVLHGEIAGQASPTQCEAVDWTYLDFMVGPGGAVEYEPPPAMTTRLVYVYKGDASFGGKVVGEGTVAKLSKVGTLKVNAKHDGCGMHSKHSRVWIHSALIH